MDEYLDIFELASDDFDFSKFKFVHDKINTKKRMVFNK